MHEMSVYQSITVYICLLIACVQIKSYYTDLTIWIRPWIRHVTQSTYNHK